MTVSSRGKKKSRNVKAKTQTSKKSTKSITKSRSRKGKTIEDSKKHGKGSGIHAGGQVGINKGGRTLGKLSAGGELGVKENKKGSGKVAANVNLGLESETLGELKEGGDYALDKIKSGVKAAKKKIAEVID
jgi:hypothetical protein